MSMDTRDKDLDRPPGMPPRPGEEQSEGEGALECVVEERDEECKFSLWDSCSGEGCSLSPNLSLVYLDEYSHPECGGLDPRWDELSVWNKWIQVLAGWAMVGDVVAPQLPQDWTCSPPEPELLGELTADLSPLNYFLGFSLKKRELSSQDTSVWCRGKRGLNPVPQFKMIWKAISVPKVPRGHCCNHTYEWLPLPRCAFLVCL